MALALVSPEGANVDHTTFRNQLCCIVGAATGIVAYRHVLVVRTEVPWGTLWHLRSLSKAALHLISG